MKFIRGVMCVVCAFGTLSASARVKLVALPQRDLIDIRLDHPGATLIEEERVLTLQQGRNQVDFSWKGVEIDVDSIRLQVLSDPGDINLLSVSYPPGEAALVWDLSSRQATNARVRISYLLRNIDQLTAYRAYADKAETSAQFKAFSVLRNFSGEDFRGASAYLDTVLRVDHVDMQHEQTTQLARFDLEKAPIRKEWVFDARVQPWDPDRVDGNVGIPVRYVIENSAAGGLGQGPLPAGRVRVFQEDGADGHIFLGEDDIPLTPVGEEMNIRIGESRDLVVTQRQMRRNQVNIRRNRNNRMVLHDTDEQIVAKVENFKAEPAVLTLIQHIPGQWVMRDCNFEYERKDAGTIEFTIELPAKESRELVMNFSRLNVR